MIKEEQHEHEFSEDDDEGRSSPYNRIIKKQRESELHYSDAPPQQQLVAYPLHNF